MCQAYDAEAAWVNYAEERETCKGYAAHRDNLSLADNPNSNPNSTLSLAWVHGWGCRESGVVPWPIDKLYRKKRSEETGTDCWGCPSIAEADELV